MNRIQRIWRTLVGWFSVPWYPLTLSAYPVLALLAYNIGQVNIGSGWRPLLASVGFAGALLILLRFLLRSWNRAAFLTTLWAILFFSYGHIRLRLRDLLTELDLESWLILIWFVFFVLSAVWTRRKNPSPAVLNVIALGLVITSLMQISSQVRLRSVNVEEEENVPVQEVSPPANPPDIYYFILDMYTREDLLKSAYGHDNSGFLKQLESRGFYVAECSQSNYSDTAQSLSSSLNLDYVQTISDSFIPEETELLGLMKLLDDNAVQRTVTHFGYQTVSFSSGFLWAEWRDADLFLAPPEGAVTEFETEIMFSTPLRLLSDKGIFSITDLYAERFRARTRFVLDGMADLPARRVPSLCSST